MNVEIHQSEALRNKEHEVNESKRFEAGVWPNN